MFTAKNDADLATMTVSMKGTFTFEQMKDFVQQMKAITDSYAGKPHCCLADLRGLAPLAPQVEKLLQEGISYTRQRGVALCAHVSDSTITRLQTLKVARQASPYDLATIDCASLEEAQKVIYEFQKKRSREPGASRAGAIG